MCRVDAQGVAAEVVDHQPVRDGSVLNLESEAVGSNLATTHD
jgi:hypothetical protein